MYAVELLTGPSLGAFNRYSLVQVCFSLNTACQTHYKNWGFRTFFIQKNCPRKFNSCELAQVGLFWDPKLGPVNNPYFDQLITIQNGHVFAFFALICAKTPILLCFLNINQNLPKKGPKKR